MTKSLELFQTNPDATAAHPEPFKVGDIVQVSPSDTPLRCWVVISNVIPAINNSLPVHYVGQVCQIIGDETPEISLGLEVEVPHDGIFRFLEIGPDITPPVVLERTEGKSTRKAIREDLVALLESGRPATPT